MRRKTSVVLLALATGVTASSLPQRAFAMSVQVPPLREADMGFSIVFDLDFVDNVLRVTLPKSAEAIHDVLTLSHPLDTLDQVVVDFIPERGVRVKFDSEPLGSGGPSSPGPGAGHGSGSVPEPTSAALLALGLFGASCVRRRRRA